MPKASPPGPDLELREIEAIAGEAPRRLPGLAPLGGPRWTREDLDLSVSFLYQETEGKAYRRAAAGGMTRLQRHRWLLMALRNRLLKNKAAYRRIDLLDDLALDLLPGSDGLPAELDSDDAGNLAERVLTKLRTQDYAILGDRLHRALFLDEPSVELQGDGHSKRAREYRWVRIREVIRAVARQGGLRREECPALLAALADKLTGGGRSERGPDGFRCIFSPLAD